MDLAHVQEAIGYTFTNEQLLRTALTHSSYVNECRGPAPESYERMEFLGDAVLELVVTENLYDSNEELSEGGLTKLRASIVCEESLKTITRRLHLGDALLLGRGEENTGGRDRDSILADVFESVLGAIFLDGGFQPAREFALRELSDTIERMVVQKQVLDHKTMLQEYVQNDGGGVMYRLVGEEGPDHMKTFHSAVFIGGVEYGRGSGRTKKAAEQAAARAAYAVLTGFSEE